MNHRIVKQILLRGGSIEFGRLAICPMDRFYRYGKFDEYQVHSDDGRFLFSEIFNDLDKAVKTFLRIGRELNAFEYKKSGETMRPLSPTQDDALRRYTGAGIRKSKRKNNTGWRGAGPGRSSAG